MTSSFVDVAIGLILMYLVLSLLCTTLNELIATAFKWRAKSLSQAIAQLIDNPQIRAAFYNHGLIANAVTASRGGSAAAATAANGQDAAVDQAKDKSGDHPSYLDGRTFAMALLDSLSDTTQGKAADSLATKKFPTVDDIQKIVGDLPDSNIRDVLLANIASGKKDIADIRDGIASWFDTAMDRLSGDYKRSLKCLSLALGLGIAVVLNADSISVSRALWKDQALRGSIVNAAADIVKQTPDAAKCDNDDLVKQSTCLADRLKADQERLQPFPVGWPDHGFLQDQANGTNVILLGFLKVLGWIWTGIALSLGAPFWFDLLQKFMNIRGSGPKPQPPIQEKADASSSPAPALPNKN
ncbi:MAG TPA: hypothetical protein VMG39_10980 [Pseudolabrys sp.]|nr:hypothetical protein [Pseudolabrys sp.]